jgi:hypothetical protein
LRGGSRADEVGEPAEEALEGGPRLFVGEAARGVEMLPGERNRNFWIVEDVGARKEQGVANLLLGTPRAAAPG